MTQPSFIFMLLRYFVGQVFSHCDGSFSFASYYGDSMVLQRAPASPVVWGYAGQAGLQVDVTLNSVLYSVLSVDGPAGTPIWRVVLEPQEGPGPAVIEATSAGCTISLNDVLFGDVWVCSGQSNMVYRLDRLDNPEPEITDVVNYPNVRTFMTGLNFSDTAQYDLISIDRNWAIATSTNMGDFSAICWLFGRDLNVELGIPIGLILTAYGGTRIEAWSSPEALDSCFPDGHPNDVDKNAASVLWNAMIHPFLELPIKGALWYQGERNRGASEDYPCSLYNMVTDWRNRWYTTTGKNMDPDFPFGQVQLAPNTDDDTTMDFPNTRWAQTYNTGFTPNTELPGIFTAIAVDLPDFDSPYGAIHPRYKRKVALRLTYAAYQLVYGINSHGPYQGPRPSSVSVNGATVDVVYEDGSANIEVRGSGNFELCCADVATDRCPDNGVWTQAPITGNTASSVTLDNPCSNSVTGMRYAWRESPCALELCAVYGIDNSLPAPPWIMDI